MRTVASPRAIRNASWLDLSEGQTVGGTVVRLPRHGQYAGTRLFLRTASGEIVSIAAAGKRGWVVLERALKEESVRVGDEIVVTFLGWRQTADRERHYRNVRLEILGRAS